MFGAAEWHIPHYVRAAGSARHSLEEESMRLLRTLSIPLVVAVLAVSAVHAPAVAQTGTGLPEYTAEQRWERAGMQTTFYATLVLRQSLQQGRTASEAGEELAALLAPSWASINAPIELAVAMRRNWLSWPNAQWELLEYDGENVRFRMSRPWRNVYREGGSLRGVAETDYDAFLRAFHEAIAAQRGLAYTQTEDGGWLAVTVRRR